MVRVTWKVILDSAVLAKSNRTVIMEGMNYFPSESVNMEYLRESDTKETCSWRGEISYYDIIVDGKVSKDAACYFAQTNPEALVKVGKEYQNYIAFVKDAKEVVNV